MTPNLVGASKFYVNHRTTWGPGRTTVMLAFAGGRQLSDLDIVAQYGMKRKTVSARRVELWRLGFLTPIGMKKMGRQRVQIWGATPSGNAEVNRLSTQPSDAE